MHSLTAAARRINAAPASIMAAVRPAIDVSSLSSSSSSVCPSSSFSLLSLRSFTTTKLSQRERQRAKDPKQLPSIAYKPVGDSKQKMNRSFEGIFAGKHVSFGNMRSHSERKTRRTWLPNVHKKTLRSDVLGKSLSLKVSTAALRSIDKFGGFDRYLLRTPLHRLDFGITRELRTDMELKLLDTPGLAASLNLTDVTDRLARPSEVKRLRRVVTERAAAAALLPDGHLHPHTLQRMPDGTIAPLIELSAEERALKEAAVQAFLEKKAAQKERAAAIAAANKSPIHAPKNVVHEEPEPLAPRGTPTKHVRRATFDHPFTAPIAKRIPTPAAVAAGAAQE